MAWKTTQIIFTTLGVLGFVGLLVLSASSSHADLLRWAALIWLLALGAINAVIVFRARAAVPPRNQRGDLRG